MSLLDRLRTLGQDREDLLHGESDPFGVPVEEVYSATEARIGGRTVLLAGTNNYLGLTFDPGCIQAAHDAGKPLDGLTKAKRGQVIKSICEQLGLLSNYDLQALMGKTFLWPKRTNYFFMFTPDGEPRILIQPQDVLGYLED